MTVSGLGVLTYTDPVTGHVFSSGAGTTGRCSIDESEPVNGYSAIRTDRAASMLRNVGGGPTGGTVDHYMCAAMRMPAPTVVGALLSAAIFIGPNTDGSCATIGAGSSGPSTFWGIAAGQHTAFESRWRIVELTFNAALGERRMYIDGAINDHGTLVNTSFSAPGYMGLGSWHPAYAPQDALVYTAVFRNSIPSQIERNRLIRYIGEKYALSSHPFFIGIGDSIMAGHIDMAHSGAVADCSTTDILAELTAQYAAEGKTIATYNRGQGAVGASYFTPVGTVNPASPSGYIAAASNGVYGPDISERQSGLNRSQTALFMIGMNDLNNYTAPFAVSASVSAADAAEMYARFTMTVHGLQADGYFVIAGGIIPHTGLNPGSNPATLALYAAFNALVLANSAGANRVINVDTLSLVCPDGIHPNNDGLAAIAALYKVEIDAAGIA
jgi:lysophospholipase L1-like esterase